jgi:hypothetical protein
MQKIQGEEMMVMPNAIARIRFPRTDRDAVGEAQ